MNATFRILVPLLGGRGVELGRWHMGGMQAECYIREMSFLAQVVGSRTFFVFKEINKYKRCEVMQGPVMVGPVDLSSNTHSLSFCCVCVRAHAHAWV